jgi:hypothetical protein
MGNSNRGNLTPDSRSQYQGYLFRLVFIALMLLDRMQKGFNNCSPNLWPSGHWYFGVCLPFC